MSPIQRFLAIAFGLLFLAGAFLVFYLNAGTPVQLLVDGHYPAQEIRSSEVSAAVPHVAAIPKVREWMKRTQRDCIQFGNLVMEGRDIARSSTLAGLAATSGLASACSRSPRATMPTSHSLRGLLWEWSPGRRR